MDMAAGAAPVGSRREGLLQRVSRAGERGEPAAGVLAVCEARVRHARLGRRVPRESHPGEDNPCPPYMSSTCLFVQKSAILLKRYREICTTKITILFKIKVSFQERS